MGKTLDQLHMEQYPFAKCCQAIIAERDKPALNYAVGYAQSGVEMRGEARRVQALYILGNIVHWRSPVARDVRSALKAWSNDRSEK